MPRRPALVWTPAYCYLDSLNFSFKCHRFDVSGPARSTTGTKTTPASTMAVYAVNAIYIHPLYRTFSTAGSDGSFSFWDQDVHLRLKTFPNGGNGDPESLGKSREMGGKGDDGRVTQAITATGFNHDGSAFAYAIGYDWSKGYGGSQVGRKDLVRIHDVREECNPMARPMKK